MNSKEKKQRILKELIAYNEVHNNFLNFINAIKCTTGLFFIIKIELYSSYNHNIHTFRSNYILEHVWNEYILYSPKCT